MGWSKTKYQRKKEAESLYLGDCRLALMCKPWQTMAIFCIIYYPKATGRNSRFFKSWPYLRPKNVIFHACLFSVLASRRKMNFVIEFV